MAKQSQVLTTLTSQPTLAVPGTPQRLSTTDIIVRAVVIEAYYGNANDMYIATSEALATSTNRHRITPSTFLNFTADRYGALDAQFNLKDIWFDGVTAGDKLVVSYFPINVEIC